MHAGRHLSPHPTVIHYLPSMIAHHGALLLSGGGRGHHWTILHCLILGALRVRPRAGRRTGAEEQKRRQNCVGDTQSP